GAGESGGRNRAAQGDAPGGPAARNASQNSGQPFGRLGWHLTRATAAVGFRDISKPRQRFT
ncbi:unnamed protein product, partial [Closterium sp. NIES-54]